MMTLRQGIGFLLILTGLVIAIAGFSISSDATVSKTINGQEVVLDNSADHHANWRSWIGFIFLGIGVVTIAFPSQETIRSTQ